MRLHTEPAAKKRTDEDTLEVHSVPGGRADADYVVYAAPIKYTIDFPFFPEGLLSILAPSKDLLKEPYTFEPDIAIRLLDDRKEELVLLGLDDALLCRAGTCWKQTKQVKVLIDRWKSVMKGLR